MKTFAQVLNSKLHWKFEAEECPEFAPEIVIVEITGQIPMPEEGWNHAGGNNFTPPTPPTVEELTLSAFVRRDELLRQAAIRIAPLQDAVDLGIATPEEETALTNWKIYRVGLNRIEQQADFPESIQWPVAP